MTLHSSLRAEPPWTVRRTAGMLVPGFTKRFDARGHGGMTYFLGIPIGRFDMNVGSGGGTELRYHRWPVVDVLDRPPGDPDATKRLGPITAAGYVRLPAGRRICFCRFRLER